MAKSTRNEFEFMSMVLDALGVEYEEADIKQRERWRGKVLDGWGVDYVVDDLKQFARWRQKCLEGLGKNSGGGGDSDFTTAQVTLKTGDNGRVFVGIPYISITGADFTVDGLTGGLFIPPNSEVILTAILYQGKLTIPENHFLVNRDESTGEYEENVSDGYITITGECSITLAPTVS